MPIGIGNSLYLSIITLEENVVKAYFNTFKKVWINNPQYK